MVVAALVRPTVCPVRGQHTLAWSWPDQTLEVQETTSRQRRLPSTSSPGRRVAVVSECPGQTHRQYCKRLSLLWAQAGDTGYYRCYYKDAKTVVVGTTATNVYVFVRGESLVDHGGVSISQLIDQSIDSSIHFSL